MTMAPPTPSRPETTAPHNPSAPSVSSKAFVIRSRSVLAGRGLGGRARELSQTRIVCGQIVHLRVGDGLHDRLQRLERLVAGATAIGLEELDLVLEVAR